MQFDPLYILEHIINKDIYTSKYDCFGDSIPRMLDWTQIPDDIKAHLIQCEDLQCQNEDEWKCMEASGWSAYLFYIIQKFCKIMLLLEEESDKELKRIWANKGMSAAARSVSADAARRTTEEKSLNVASAHVSGEDKEFLLNEFKDRSSLLHVINDVLASIKAEPWLLSYTPATL